MTQKFQKVNRSNIQVFVCHIMLAATLKHFYKRFDIFFKNDQSQCLETADNAHTPFIQATNRYLKGNC